ncbi:hypothetical protein NUS48_05565 [Glaesserella parasuis]|nr:hypothetical protein [Glaesserella parasuis]MDE3970422.1 hypothetical protein [Glaesserella parasuis]MDE3982349.1 hypothetical protein [Glaesserella parasuis]MDE3991300.1 hypothetical protein [Glaesserella parasuis]
MQNQDLVAKIKYAIEKVKKAEQISLNSSAVETIDFFSKNKLISVWSSYENYQMKNALTELERALNDLKQAIYSVQINSLVSAPNDLIDLGFDYFSDWDTDWLSLYNMHKTFYIHSQCQKIYIKLNDLLNKIENG